MVAIFVAFMFLSMVITDLGVQKWKARRAAGTARPWEPQANLAAFAPEDLCQVPDGIHLSSAHTWLRPDPSGGLEIGADPFITHAVGAIRRVVLPNPGDQVTAGQTLFHLERNGRSIAVPSTITGKVMAVNSHLQDRPGLLSSDPYGSGWICLVIPTTIEAMTPRVRFGEKAILWMESEFARLGEFLSTHLPTDAPLGATSQDGGLPSSGCLAELDKAAWSAFETEFLRWK